MKVWSVFVIGVLLTACSSPETEAAKTVSYDTVEEMKEEDSIESSAGELETTRFVLPNEEVVLSFRTAKNKQVFLCRDQNNKYLVYRFGSKTKVELQFPQKLDESSFQKFEYSSYFRGGGVANLGMNLDYLSFKNDEYRYIIYKTYVSESVGNEDEVGIRVMNLKTNKKITISGDFNTFEGGFPEEIMDLVNQSENLYE